MECKTLFSTALQRQDCYRDLVELDNDIFLDPRAKQLHQIIKNYSDQNVTADLSCLLSDYAIKSDKMMWSYVNEIVTTSITFNHKSVINNLLKEKQMSVLKVNYEKLVKNKITIDEFKRNLEHFETDDDKDEYCDVSEITVRDLERMYKETKYYSTGLQALDRVIMGLFKGQLITIAGVPGEGKTSLALQILSGHKSSFFSLEMKRGELISKILSRQVEVPSVKIETNQLKNFERDKIIKQVLENKNLKIRIYDKSSDFNFIINRIKRDVENGVCEIAGIDYLQIIAGLQGFNKTEKLTEATRILKNTAHSLNIPLINLSQFKKEGLKPDTEPGIGDLLGSGSIFNDSDVVIFLWNKKGRTQMSVKKGRKSGTGAIQNIDFEKRFSRFVDC